MQAQRDCLNWAAAAVAGLPGPVLEIGLGNGRTYDHLRALFPDRAIYVFDRRVAAHPACVPPDDRLFLGEVVDTLPRAAARLGRTAALVHSDLGTGNDVANGELAELVAPRLAALVRPGGLVVANHVMAVDTWALLPEPPGVKPGRYYLYRATA